MHLIGSWHSLPPDRPNAIGDFSFIELRISDAATVLQDHRRKLVYEGIIFDATNQQLLDDPTLLDRAFGFYTYVLFENESGAIYLGADRLGYSPVYYGWESKTFRFS